MDDGAAFLGLGQIGAEALGAWFWAPAFGQGWSRRTDELKEKGIMTWRGPGSV
ncbi:hypothetical protein I79_012409 [Cricetulus griseus]|uniref:Uncharacterized protein n=1 Tax=Cricetulus griseus TaxID=10029 RepID=G3HNR6_CRIGR|nr:hypothetical protein I79_012409 [Cricetulus griseus]